MSSKGWQQCGDFLVEKLKTYTPHVQEQNSPIKTYDGKSHTLRNIIASFSPEKTTVYCYVPIGTRATLLI